MNDNGVKLPVADDFLKLIGYVTVQFLNQKDWLDNIGDLLHRIGAAARVSHTFMIKISTEDGEAIKIDDYFSCSLENIFKSNLSSGVQISNANSPKLKLWFDQFNDGHIINHALTKFTNSEHLDQPIQLFYPTLVVPIFVGSILWGCIGIESVSENKMWSSREIDALKTIASSLGTALHRKQVEEMLRSKASELEALRIASIQMTSNLELKSVLYAILEQTLRLISADDAHIFLYDGGKLSFGSALWAGGNQQKPFAEPRSDGITYKVAESGEMILVSNMRTHVLFESQPWDGAIIGLPLIFGQKVRGVMNVAYDKPHEFNEHEIHILELFADQAAIALENSRLYSEALNRGNELDALHLATSSLLSTINLKVLLRNILNAAIKAISPAEKGSLILVDRDTEKLNIRAVSGYLDPRVKLLDFSDKSGYVVKCIREKKPLLINAVRDDPTLRYSGALSEVNSIHSVIVAPLGTELATLGAISLDSTERGAFSKADLRLLISFAATATAAIKNAQLHDQVQTLAITDSLTEVYNRRGLMELGKREVERALRFDRSLSLIIFDIDHFKSVNDTYGHPCGDIALSEVAKMCKEQIRDVDILGRYGGEEFIVLLPEADEHSANFIAERLRIAISQMEIYAENNLLRLTISLGISCVSEQTRSLQSLIKSADEALYNSKKTGRNKVSISSY